MSDSPQGSSAGTANNAAHTVAPGDQTERVAQKVVGERAKRVDAEDIGPTQDRKEGDWAKTTRDGVLRVLDLVASRKFGMFAGAVSSTVDAMKKYALTESVFERAEKMRVNEAWECFASAYAQWSSGTPPPPEGGKAMYAHPNQHSISVGTARDAERPWSGAQPRATDMGGLHLQLTMVASSATNAEPTARYGEEDVAEPTSYIRQGSAAQYGRMSPAEKALHQRRRWASRLGGGGAVWYDSSLEVVGFYDYLRQPAAGRRWQVPADVDTLAGQEVGEGRTRWTHAGVQLVSRGPPRRRQGGDQAGQINDPVWAVGTWHVDREGQIPYVDRGAEHDAAVYYSIDQPAGPLPPGVHQETYAGTPGRVRDPRVMFLSEGEYLAIITRDPAARGVALDELLRAGAVAQGRTELPEFDDDHTYVVFASQEQLENDAWVRSQMEFWFRDAAHLGARPSGRVLTGVNRLIFVHLDVDGLGDRVAEAVVRLGARRLLLPRCQWMAPDVVGAVLGDASNWGLGGDWYAETDYRNAFAFLSAHCVFFGRPMEAQETVLYGEGTSRALRGKVWRRFWEIGAPEQVRRVDLQKSPHSARYRTRTGYTSLAEGLGYVRVRPGSLEGLGEWATRRAAAGGAILDAYANALGAGIVFDGPIYQRFRGVADFVAIFGFCLHELSFGSQVGSGRYRWLDGRTVGAALLPARPTGVLRFAGAATSAASDWAAHVRFPWGEVWPRLAVTGADRPYNPMAGTAIPNIDLVGDMDTIGVLQDGTLSAGSQTRILSDPILAARWLGEFEGVEGGGSLKLFSAGGTQGLWTVRVPRFEITPQGGGAPITVVLPFLPPRKFERFEVGVRWEGWTGTGSSSREVSLGFVGAGLVMVPEVALTQGEWHF